MFWNLIIVSASKIIFVFLNNISNKAEQSYIISFKKVFNTKK